MARMGEEQRMGHYGWNPVVGGEGGVAGRKRWMKLPRLWDVGIVRSEEAEVEGEKEVKSGHKPWKDLMVSTCCI